MFIVYEMGSKIGLAYIVFKIMEMFFKCCMEWSSSLADISHMTVWAVKAIHAAPLVLLLLGFMVVRFGGQPVVYGIVILVYKNWS